LASGVPIGFFRLGWSFAQFFVFNNLLGSFVRFNFFRGWVVGFLIGDRTGMAGIDWPMVGMGVHPGAIVHPGWGGIWFVGR
jgi:hypothetical protein